MKEILGKFMNYWIVQLIVTFICFFLIILFVTPIGKMAYEGFTMNISKTITPSIIEAITPVVENAIDKRLTTFENNHFSSLSSYLVELNKILAEKKILTAEELTVLNEKAVKIGPN